MSQLLCHTYFKGRTPNHPRILFAGQTYANVCAPTPPPSHTWPTFRIGSHVVHVNTWCACPNDWIHKLSARFYTPGISSVNDLHCMLTRSVMFSCCIPELSVYYCVISTTHGSNPALISEENTAHFECPTAQHGDSLFERQHAVLPSDQHVISDRLCAHHKNLGSYGQQIDERLRDHQREFSGILTRQLDIYSQKRSPSVHLSLSTDQIQLSKLLRDRTALELKLSDRVDFTSPELTEADSSSEYGCDFGFHYTQSWSDLIRYICPREHDFVGYVNCEACDLATAMVYGPLSKVIKDTTREWKLTIFKNKPGTTNVSWPSDIYLKNSLASDSPQFNNFD